MSYRNRIAQLEQEVDDRSALWEKSKPYQPYAAAVLASATLMGLARPKWMYRRDPVTRQKKFMMSRFLLGWVALSVLLGALYYAYTVYGRVRW
jgi:hypothetical protein